MLLAASRFAAVAALALFGAGTEAVAADAPPPRVPPSRPATVTDADKVRLTITRIGGVDYFDLDEAMARLGLAAKKSEAGRKVTFSGRGNELVLEGESRETSLNGLRVFLGQRIAVQRGNLYVSKIDFERCLQPVLRPELIGMILARPKIIAIDPGHGGIYDGMENPRLGVKEKVCALDVALRVQKLLQTAGFKIVMTRTTDRELAPDLVGDWKRRYEIANAARADLFVSIHFNALERDTVTRGMEIFTFTRQFQRSDQSWSPGQGDDTETEIAPVNRFDAWSALAAQLLHREVLAELKTPDRGHKTKHLAVLRGLNCPGVLIESAFLSNDIDAKLVATPAYRQEIAEAIADGIRAYAAELESLAPKPATGTTPASGTSNSR